MADPVAVSTLHARLLAEVPPPLSARGDASPVSRAQAAVRAVVELHAPRESCFDGPQCGYCADQCHSGSGLSCDRPDAAYPCDEIKIIAHELGVEIGETP